MGIFGKISNRANMTDYPYGNNGGLFGGIPTKAGTDISEFNAMQLAVVWCCIKILAEDSASLPLHLYRKLKGGGKERATDHPLYYLLHDQPNPEMTAFSFREAYMAHLLSWGNGYAEIVKAGRGMVAGLWPITPNRATPNRNSDGQIIYKISLPQGGMTDLPKSQILHTPGLGFNGLIGYSPIGMAREAIGLGKALEEFGETYFGNGTHPGVIVEHPGQLSKQAHSNLQTSLTSASSGLGKAHRLLLLEEGMKFQKIGIPPEEAQFLETRKFQNIDIGTRIYRIPPHMYGEMDRATFSNIEQQALDYVSKALRPWLVRLEQSFNMALLTPQERGTYFFEHLVDGLLRGDLRSRYSAYQIAKQSRFMTTNEIREIENMNPIEGEDKLDVTPNMTPAVQPNKKAKLKNNNQAALEL